MVVKLEVILCVIEIHTRLLHTCIYMSEFYLFVLLPLIILLLYVYCMFSILQVEPKLIVFRFYSMFSYTSE